MTEYIVKNKISAPSLSSVKFGGKIGERTENFLDFRYSDCELRQKTFSEAERQFDLKKDDETPIGYWSGEFWGKLAVSGTRVYKHNKSDELKAFLLASAKRVLKYQREDGYLGSYADADNILAADTSLTEPIMGWKCNWNWNVWCRKYTLWGLLEIYSITNDGEILLGAKKLADHLMNQLCRMGVHLCDVGTFNGLPACSIIKPMLSLYDVTEDKKYLDFCVNEAEFWDSDSDRMPNLIRNALSGEPVHEWYPSPELWAKAYEFMSCLDGLCELYRYTADNRYLMTVENCVRLIRKYDRNVLFSVGFNDQFTGAARWQNCLSEPCDVIHWIRICHELYMLTAKPEYIDDIEFAFLNPLLAALNTENGERHIRAVRTSGRHMVVEGQCDMIYNHCCTDNMPRGILNVAETYCTFSDSCVYINMYTDFSCELSTNFGKVSVEICGSYLTDGKVTVKLSCENACGVMLRIPSHSERAAVTLDGKTIHPTADCGYCRVKAKRGENEIFVSFERKVEIRDFGGVVCDFDDEDYRFRRFSEVNDNCVDREHSVWKRQSMLTYGPLLLTRSKICGNTPKEMFFSDKTVFGGDYSCKLFFEPSDETTLVKYIAHFESSNDSFDTYVCDYASGSNRLSEDDMELFSIWF